MKHLIIYEQFLEEGYFDLKNKVYTLYHATLEKNLDSIKKRGILPSLPSDKPYSEGLVWFADSLEGAYKHATNQRKKRGETGNIVVLEVYLRPGRSKLNKAISKGIYTHTGIVEPENIYQVIDQEKLKATPLAA